MSDGEFPAIDGNALGELCSVMIDRATVGYLIGSVKWLASEDRYFGDIEDIYETTQAFEQFARRLMLVTDENECVELVAIPVGTIQMYAGAAAPDGWLLCNGDTYLKADYPELYAVLGSNFDKPFGEETDFFGAPFLEGRSPIGLGGAPFDVIGAQSGSLTHTLTTAEMPAHNHTQDAHTHPGHQHNIFTQTGSTSGSGSVGLSSGGGSDSTRQTSSTQTPAATAVNQSTGGGQAHSNLHPVCVVNFIIKT